MEKLPEIWRQKCASLQLWLHQLKVRLEHGEFLSRKVQRGCIQEGTRGMSVGMQSKGGWGIQNLLTHCNHQAEARGATGSQVKSSFLSFRRTKWCFPSTVKNCGMWLKEENGTVKWNCLRESKRFCVSPLASQGAGRMMQSEEGNNVAVALWVKIKARNKGLAKRRQQDFNLFGKGKWKRRGKDLTTANVWTAWLEIPLTHY